MFRIRSKQFFKKHYLENLLSGDTSELSADRAMTQTKAQMRAWLAADDSLTDSRKERLYSIAFDELVDWQMLLVDLPQISCQACREKLQETLDKMRTLDGSLEATELDVELED